MAKGEFRDTVVNNITDFCDTIENELNEIIRDLEKLQGLSEVDNIRDSLQELADKIY